ncbi:RDD family protein [Streptomyces sp. NPDC002845]
MSSQPPPFGSGQSPDDDQFKKQPPPDRGGGSPYDTPSTPPPYDSSSGAQPPPSGDPYGGGGPYGGDPLAGMPPLADSGKRVLARIIDMIMVGVAVWLVAWGFGLVETTFDTDDINTGDSFGQGVIAAVLYMGYDIVFTTRNGQTLGKQLMKLRVANLNDGSTPSMQTALMRAAVLWIPFAFCCACIWTAIAGGWSFFDKPYKQGLHDKAAKTVVVSTG